MKFRLISFNFGILLFVFQNENNENALIGIQIDNEGIILHLLFIPFYLKRRD